MIEQVNNAVKFLAFFTASKQGKTGLTVTVDVYNPAGTQIVTAGSATALGGGLYTYTLASGSVTTEGEYAAIFKTSDGTVDQQHIPALWVVGRAGIEDLDAAISSRLATSGYTAPTTPPTVTAIRQEMDSNSTKLANLDATVSSRLATSGYTTPPTAATIAAAVWDALLSGITTTNSIGKLIKDYLDAAISSRLATNGYTAPTTPPTAAAIRAEIDANSTKLDVAVSTRLATSGYTAPTTPPTVTEIRTELDSNSTKLANLDAPVSSRLAASSYVAPSTPPTAAAIADAVWDEALTDHTTAGTTGKKLGDVTGGSSGGLTTEQDALLQNLDVPVSSRLSAAGYTVPPTVAAIADAVWNRLTSAISTANSIGKLLVDNINATIGSRLAASSYAAPTTPPTTTEIKAALQPELGRLDVAVSSRAVAADLDVTVDGGFTSADRTTLANLDVAVSTRATPSDIPAAPSVPTAAQIADAVLDEALTDHQTAGTAGAALQAQANAADPLMNAVPGSYAQGTAGYVLGQVNGNIKVTLVSPLAQNGDITLVRGDDYKAADGRALVWTDASTGWPVLTGGSVKLVIKKRGDSTKIEISGVVVNADTVRVEPLADKTGLLSVGGDYTYALEVTLGGSHITLQTGKVTVLRGA